MEARAIKSHNTSSEEETKADSNQTFERLDNSARQQNLRAQTEE